MDTGVPPGKLSGSPCHHARKTSKKRRRRFLDFRRHWLFQTPMLAHTDMASTSYTGRRKTKKEERGGSHNGCVNREEGLCITSSNGVKNSVVFFSSPCSIEHHTSTCHTLSCHAGKYVYYNIYVHTYLMGLCNNTRNTYSYLPAPPPPP